LGFGTTSVKNAISLLWDLKGVLLVIIA